MNAYFLQVCTMDRFIAIKYPFCYQRLQISPKFSKFTIIMLLTMWVPSLTFTVTAILYKATDHQMFVIRNTLILSAALVLIISNVMVYTVAKKHHQTINKQEQRTRTREVKMLKSTYVCICIVASFVVLWTPLFIHNFLFIYYPKELHNADDNFTYIVEIIAIFNSVLDPILFVIFRQDVKKAMKTWGGVFKSHNSDLLLTNFSNNPRRQEEQSINTLTL